MATIMASRKGKILCMEKEFTTADEITKDQLLSFMIRSDKKAVTNKAKEAQQFNVGSIKTF
jgi:hypothetical protein